MAALCREAAMSALTNAVSKAEAEAIEAGPEAAAAAAAAVGSPLAGDAKAGAAVARAADLRVGPENFDEAFRMVKPSITWEQREFYRRYAEGRH
jgi:SpoVK/Ycf46/Vps4 family AAA+-type ATPase